VTQQVRFGGYWTQQKLQVLSKYLKAYRTIFDRNERAKYFRTIYVDAFAGTGVIPRPDLEGSFIELIPDLEAAEGEFRKGSVRRALEVSPPFHQYVFIEKSTEKCEELLRLKENFPDRTINVINDDANAALLSWCGSMDTRRERAVIFLDPFGASVDWNVIGSLAATNAIDLWILFPFAAVNRMLTKDPKPSASWTEKLNRVFGTGAWEEKFYASDHFPSLLESDGESESVYKCANQSQIVQFFVERLRTVFVEVAEPGLLYNSRGLLFVLFFGTGNRAGLKIANDLIRGLSK
jgi:three-Cys-motif partner protein